MLPTVVLTFANDENDHLTLLKEESSEIYWTLHPFHEQGAVELYKEESGTVEELVKVFEKYPNRISIFHYAGHAGGEGLRLEGGDGHAGGLAGFFAQQKDNLKLVFLNGCSTKPQVELLLQLGVKAVIATSSPIADPKAVFFSKAFYGSLAAKQTIERAFDHAVAALQTKYKIDGKPAIIEFRGFKTAKKEKKEEVPWGLYVKEEHRNILKWRLPHTPRSLKYLQDQDDYKPNDYLRYMLDAMLYLDPVLAEKLCNDKGELVDIKGNLLSDQEKFYLILQHLPWPIGAQFQKLIALRAPNIERLKQIAGTYLIISQTLLFIILAQVWEKGDEMTAANKKVLREAINLNRDQFLLFDYLGQIEKLHLKGVFDEAVPPFVREIIPFLKELKDDDSELSTAYTQLESLRDGLWEKTITAEEAPAFCEDAEFSLTILLSRVAFLVKYSMIAVRDIQIINFKHSDTISYQHRLGELNGVGDMLGLSARKLKKFTNSDSVILVRDIKDLDDPECTEDFINLTPFIIDENAYLNYSSNVLNIQMFAYREGDIYYYYKVNNNIFHVLENEDLLLEINPKRGDQEDQKLKKFLPVKLGSFLGQDEQHNGNAIIHRRKPKNPYTVLVDQFHVIMNKFSE